MMDKKTKVGRKSYINTVTILKNMLEKIPVSFLPMK